MTVSRADASPQRIIQRANAVLTLVGDNAPTRVDCGTASVLSSLIRYTDSGADTGQFEMLAQVFDGARWKRVSIENVGILTVVAGTGATFTAGTQTTFDQALKVIQAARGSIEVEYVWTMSKRIYAVRFNFIELSAGLGSLENIVTLSVD